jgi:hypothetical protein
MLAHEGPYLIDMSFLSLAYITGSIAATRARAHFAGGGAAVPLVALIAPASLAAALLAVCAGVTAARRAVRRWVRRHIVSRDELAHADRWAALLARGDEVAALQRLRLLARAWRAGIDRPVLRQPAPSTAAAAQCSRSRLGWLIRPLWWWGGAAPRAVESLEDLYGLAARAEGLLQAKAQDLALAADGCFFVVAGKAAAGQRDTPAERRVEAWSTAAGRAAAGEVRVEWGGLKAAGRAAEKLVRCYGGDPSRILDCCRWTEEGLAVKYGSCFQ